MVEWSDSGARPAGHADLVAHRIRASRDGLSCPLRHFGKTQTVLGQDLPGAELEHLELPTASW
jgi:hypothetical protein